MVNLQTLPEAVAAYVDRHNDPQNGFDIINHVVMMCPSRCIDVDLSKKSLSIRDEECVKCMHCINVMPKALRVGEEGRPLASGGVARPFGRAGYGRATAPASGRTGSRSSGWRT